MHFGTVALITGPPVAHMGSIATRIIFAQQELRAIFLTAKSGGYKDIEVQCPWLDELRFGCSLCRLLTVDPLLSEFHGGALRYIIAIRHTSERITVSYNGHRL